MKFICRMPAVRIGIMLSTATLIEKCELFMLLNGVVALKITEDSFCSPVLSEIWPQISNPDK